MRAQVLAGFALVAAGGLLVLFAPAAPLEEPLGLASADAPQPEPRVEEPARSLAFMAGGAAAGLAGLALLARAFRPRDLE